MVDSNLLAYLWGLFADIYRLGDRIIILRMGEGVSLNNFLLVLFIMTIILTSLLNFIKVHSVDSVSMVGSSAKSIYGKVKSRIKDKNS